MVQNDTRRFDLLELAPVSRANGWVLLGEVDRYVRVSNDRFDAVSFALPSTPARSDRVSTGGGGGITVQMRGSVGESTAVTALEPVGTAEKAEWVVHVQRVTFASESATLVFGDV